MSDLWYAAGRGDEALVNQLTKQGARVNWRGERNWTALHKAAMSGYTRVVNRLLDSGWSLDTGGQSKDIYKMICTGVLTVFPTWDECH